MTPPSQEGRNQWSKHVLCELERLSKCVERTNDEIKKLSVDVGKLQVKSTAWGLIGGMIPPCVVLLYMLIRKTPC